MRNSKQQPCTLDNGNIGSLAYLWKALTAEHPDMYAGLQDGVLNRNSESYKVLIANDPALLGMLKNWVQSTNIITNEIAERVAMAEARAAAQKTQEQEPPKDQA